MKKESTNGNSNVHSTHNGEQYIELSPSRRVSVRMYKGVKLVDLRQFYGRDGEKKPGKKGIALTVDQWKCLRRSVRDIDTMIQKVSS
ncbi:RNA polymerase II transcriptional coactivator [Gautieria morchelliformis]|nr:RNA polymerase II transcriptional coactivator [Gautieria morchelliformis]